MRLLPIRRWESHMDSLKQYDTTLWLNHMVHGWVDFAVAGLVLVYLLMLAAVLFFNFVEI